MDFHGEGGSMSPANLIEYIQKQLPTDLTTLVNLQAELAQRQGAMSAVQDATADRAKAAEELATAQDQAAAMLASAKDKESAAKAKIADLKTREDALATSVSAFEAASAAREAALVAREKTSDTREMHQKQTQDNLDVLGASLATQESALQARVKAFQDKVASISA
jgi:hypothetical protein